MSQELELPLPDNRECQRRRLHVHLKVTAGAAEAHSIGDRFLEVGVVMTDTDP